MKSFYNFENRYHIRGILRARTALSIGGRASLMPTGSDLPVIKTPDGVPFIPGSSLKGAIRAYVERIMRTLQEAGKKVNGHAVWACDPLDDKSSCLGKVVRKERNDTDTKKSDRDFTQELWDKSCTVCRLFGSQLLASRVAFQDAILCNPESLVHMVEVRDGVGIDRDLGTARTGIKFDFETVPPGAEFDLHIIVENADEWEVGIVVVALESLGQGLLALGGKSTRGLGWMELTDLQIECIRAENLLAYLAGQPVSKVSGDELRQALLRCFA